MGNASQSLGGFVKLHRQILNWEWYGNANTRDVFIHLLLKANFKDTRWQGMEIKRGQVVTSLQSLSKDLKLSIRSVRTALEKLKSTGELTIKTTNKFSLITIVKYEVYQSENGESDPQTDKQTTNERQTNDNSVRKKRMIKNDKNNIQSTCVDRASVFDSEFNDVWKLYPKKQGKAGAKKAYVKARKKGTPQQTIIDGLNAYVRYINQNRIEAQYIKQGSTWFNGQCWSDEYGECKAQGGGKSWDGIRSGVSQDEIEYQKQLERHNAEKRKKMEVKNAAKNDRG